MRHIFRGGMIAAAFLFISMARPCPVLPDGGIASVHNFSARVRQIKYFSDLGDEVTFHGTLQYARPGRMRWEFREPDPSTLLIKPGEVWLLVPGIKQAQRMGPRAQAKIQGFLMGFEKSLPELQKEYHAAWDGEENLPQGQARVLKLAHPGDVFASQIWIWFDTQRGIPLRVRWVAPNGDSTVTDFFDIRVDAGVEEKVFDLSIPRGYETIVQEGG